MSQNVSKLILIPTDFHLSGLDLILIG